MMVARTVDPHKYDPSAAVPLRSLKKSQPLNTPDNLIDEARRDEAWLNTKDYSREEKQALAILAVGLLLIGFILGKLL